jgi:hypothetical protein
MKILPVLNRIAGVCIVVLVTAISTCVLADKTDKPKNKNQPGEHHHPTTRSAGDGPVTAAQVQVAIEKAQKFLLAHRNKKGTWDAADKAGAGEKVTDPSGRQWGGLTAIATYALLASGVDARSPELKPAVDFLLDADIESTYGVGLASQIALPEFHIPEKDTRALVKRNTALILGGMNQPPPGSPIKNGQGWKPETGFYSYVLHALAKAGKLESTSTSTPNKAKDFSTKGGKRFDRSNSQYAVLGMWALEEAAGEIPSTFWQIEDAAWKKAQLSDGAWNYRTGGNPDNEDRAEAPRPSMTAAGIATLFLTQDYTSQEDWSVCKGGVKNLNIERGLAWMDKHIAEALAGNTYTMYGIERIGTASGRKYFGTRDWYQIGAEYLVTHQLADGAFNGGHGVIPSTSFALLFLSRGRAPVIMNKLQYDIPSAEKDQKDLREVWDERPRDIANLAKWIGRQDETYLNWQVVNLKVGPEQLHDAPILYISGSRAFEFSAAEQIKLRTYVEQGGMILGNADCGREAFSKAFINLGHQLFPKYEFRQCRTDDLIYREQFKDFRVKPKVLELSNGVRKLMMLIPDTDSSRAWQTASTGTKELSFALGANIFLYAVDKRNLTTKGDTYLQFASPHIKATRSVKIARVDIGDNPNPEPGGWTRLAAVMHNRHKLDLTVDWVKPDALTGYQAAVITGTGKLTTSTDTMAALQKFVTGGGTLIIDAAGGDVDYADSVEALLAAMFPSNKLELLADTSPIYSNPSEKLEKITWREFAKTRVADIKHAKIRGITFGNRTAVYFSREDLSAGLVGEPVDGIYGYSPETATNLMASILLQIK